MFLTGTMQYDSLSSEIFNLSPSKMILTAEAQSNGFDGHGKAEANVSGAINNKINGINGVNSINSINGINGMQNGLPNGKASHAERYNINGDSTIILDDSLRELKFDESRKNGFEDIIH